MIDRRAAFLVLLFVIASVPTVAGGGAGDPEDDRTPLVVWFHSYSSDNAQPAIDRFSDAYEVAHPEIDLDWIMVPGDWNQKMLTALAAHLPDPDVFEVTSGMELSITNVRDGQLLAIDDLYPPNREEIFMPAKLEEQTMEGQIYGVPTFGDGGLFYYVKSVFEDAGIPMPPKTWTELLAAAEAVNTPQMKGIFPHANGGTIFAGNMPEISGAADRRISDDGTDFVWDNNTDRVIAGLEALRTLAQSDYVLLAAPQPWWDPSAIINGFCAIQWGGLWMFPRIKEALGEDFGVFPIPALDDEPGSRPTTHFGGWGVSINGHTDQPDAAREYVKWMWIDDTGFDIQLEWNTSAIGFKIPPKFAVRDVAFNDVYDDPRIREIVRFNMELTGPPEASYNLWDTVMSATWNQMASDVANTQRPIEQLLANAARDIQRRLDEVNAGSNGQ